MKTLKFKSHLVKLIKEGKKTSTWRLFDEKNLAVDDEVALYEEGIEKSFAIATLTHVTEKTLGSLTDADWIGHERFTSTEDMYATYRSYYGPNVSEDTTVKIITFSI